MYLCIIVTVFCALSATATLPSYVKQCKKGDSACLLENANNAVSHIAKEGDADLELGNFSIKIPKVEERKANIKLVSTNIEIYGLEELKLTSLELTDDKLNFVAKIPHILQVSDYNIDAHIMMLPIKGEGKANLTGVDNTITYTSKIKIVDKDGKKFYSIESDDATVVPTSGNVHLTNLFSGDEKLGEQMNKFLNENWEAAFEELCKDPINETLTALITKFIMAFFNKFAIDELFSK